MRGVSVSAVVNRIPRKLVVGERTFRYFGGHEHQVDESKGYPIYLRCTDLLHVRLDRRPRCELVVAFRVGPNRLVGDADSDFHSGKIELRTPEGGVLNLHEPGVVRAFLDAGMARGWIPEEAPFRIDGWPLFEEVVRCAAQRPAPETAITCVVVVILNSPRALRLVALALLGLIGMALQRSFAGDGVMLPSFVALIAWTVAVLGMAVLPPLRARATSAPAH